MPLSKLHSNRSFLPQFAVGSEALKEGVFAPTRAHTKRVCKKNKKIQHELLSYVFLYSPGDWIKKKNKKKGFIFILFFLIDST